MRSKQVAESITVNEDNGNFSGAASRIVANDDTPLSRQSEGASEAPRGDEFSHKLELGEFFPIVEALSSKRVSEGVCDDPQVLSTRHRRLLLEGGYYGLVASLQPAQSELRECDVVTVLAKFMAGQQRVSPREVRALMARSSADVDDIVALSQLCSLGSVFGALPKTFAHEAIDMLSALASRLEAAGDRRNAFEVYLRLGSMLAVTVTEGAAVARALYKHARDVAPDAATRAEASLREVESAALLKIVDSAELREGLRKLFEEGVEVPRYGRWQLALRLGQALLKLSNSGEEYLERTVDFAARSGDIATAFHGQIALGNLWMSRGEFSKATDLLVQAEKIASTMGFPMGVLGCQVSRAHIMMNQGEHDAVRAKLRHLIEDVQSIPGGMAYALPIAVNSAQLGLFDECERILSLARRSFKATGARALEIQALHTHAQCLASRGDVRNAISMYSKIERIQREQGNEAEAVEAQVLSLQTRLTEVASAIGDRSKRATHTRIIKKTRQLLDSLPPGDGNYLRAKLAQVDGHMHFLMKRYSEAQRELDRAKALFQSLRSFIDFAFASGLLGLVQMEAARQGGSLNLPLLEFAHDNLIQSAEIMQRATIRREAARMWHMAAIVSVDLSRGVSGDGSAQAPIDEERRGMFSKCLRNAEHYLNRSWQCLDELQTLGVMDQPGTAHSGLDPLRQIIQMALNVARVIAQEPGSDAGILQKWELRAEHGNKSEIIH